MNAIVCNKREPSISVSNLDCRFSYKMAIDNPADHMLAVCASCDRGKAIFFSSEEGRGRVKIMGTNKPCSCGCGKSSVKDGLSGKCYKKKHGAPAYPKKSPVNDKSKPAIKPRNVKVKANVRNRNKEGQDLPQEGLIYTISVDLQEYPNLHERLLGLARGEHRTPAMQLVHMLDETFAAGEEKIGKS